MVIVSFFAREAAMPFYLSFDGGGSKCCAIFYDDRGPLGYGYAGGTNTNFTSMEDCRGNIERCLDQALDGYPNPNISLVHVTLVGPGQALAEALASRAEIGRLNHIGEGLAGLLAGALRQSGMVALSGTGSDAFCVSPAGEYDMVGGLGSILGDQGSGVWIGQNALRAALAFQEGFGEKTMLLPLLHEAWGTTDKWELVHSVYGEKAPFRKVASFVPVAAKAARLGDPISLALFEQAGQLMAEQTLALARRVSIPKEERFCVCAGGTWKAHPAMYQAFSKRMAGEAPDINIKKPLFEPVMAGVIAKTLHEGPFITENQIKQKLLIPYQQFLIQWGEV